MKRPSDSARGATAPAVEQRYVIPLRQTVMFPDMVVPIVLNRPASLTALDAALAADKIILALSQKAAEDDHPGPENVYHTGCLCKVLQTMRTADGTAKLLLEGGFGFRSFHARITDTRNRHNPKRGGRGIFVEPLVPTNHQPRRGGII